MFDKKNTIIYILVFVAILLIAGGVFLYFLISKSRNNEYSNIPQNNYAKTLEEIAEEEGTPFENYIPQRGSTNIPELDSNHLDQLNNPDETVKTLEEIAEEQGKSFEDLVPQRNDVKPLD
ncbi:MAG: hypothetical protein V1851_02170 [Patescibacteria group bacterium]